MEWRVFCFILDICHNIIYMGLVLEFMLSVNSEVKQMVVICRIVINTLLWVKSHNGDQNIAGGRLGAAVGYCHCGMNPLELVWEPEMVMKHNE